MAFTSPASSAETEQQYVDLATTVADAIAAEIVRAGGATLFDIATAAGIVPSDLGSFLGPNAGDNTFPQHQATISLQYANQILGGLPGDREVSLTLSAAPV